MLHWFGAPNGQVAVLSTTERFLAIDIRGVILWQQSTQETIEAAVISGDGKSFISFSGGNVHWYRLRDGVKYATLFIHAGGRHWVMWTPSGYYWASPVAEDLIGWHVNRGIEQAPDFYPASKMAERFNRPDIVKRCLAEALPDTELPDVLKPQLNIAAAVRGIPRVAILTPQGDTTLPEGSSTALVEASVEDTGGGVDEFRVQINGKTQIAQRLQPHPSARRTLRFEVPLAPGDNAVRVSAFNTNRTESHAAQVTFRIPERKQTSVLHGLFIGAGKYQNPKYQLTAPVRDAEAMSSTLSEVAKPLYTSIRCTVLRDEQVVKPQIAAAFDAIRQQAQPADTFILYYAGHGVLAEPDAGGQPRFVLVTTDILQMHGHSERVLEKGVSDAELRAWCQAIPAQKQVIFLDACQSGGAVETIAMRGDDEERALAQLSRAAGVVVFAASTDQEGAAEITSLGHGLFTYAVLEGLQGKARMQDRPVTVRSLDAWISQTVPELSQKYRNRMQIPTSLHRGQDFPLALPPAR